MPLVVCKKARFATQEQANLMLKIISTVKGDGDKPIRAYKCKGSRGKPGCGGWHLTKWSAEYNQRIQKWRKEHPPKEGDAGPADSATDPPVPPARG